LSPNRLRAAAIASLLALVVFCLAWELWIAPLRAGGSWLALKALPLLAALPGFIGSRRYTFQWASMLALAYVGEGAVRAWSDPPPGRALAALEIALATALFTASILFARMTRPTTRR